MNWNQNKDIIKVAEQLKKKLKENAYFKQEANTQDLQECNRIIENEYDDWFIMPKLNKPAKGIY